MCNDGPCGAVSSETIGKVDLRVSLLAMDWTNTVETHRLAGFREGGDIVSRQEAAKSFFELLWGATERRRRLLG